MSRGEGALKRHGAQGRVGPLEVGRRLLLINIARIGDTLMGTPLLRALHGAGADVRVHCMAHPKRAAVLEGLPTIHRLWRTTPKRLRLRDHLPGRRWDTAFVLGHEPPLVRYALRAAHRVVAYHQEDEALNRRLWRVVEVPGPGLHAVHERLLLTEAAGIPSQGREIDYRIYPHEAHWAGEWLRRHHALDRPLIVLQIASFPTKAYRDWPLERFLALAEGLLQRYPDALFLLNGGRESRDRCRRFAAAFPGSSLDVTGTLPLRRSAALLQRADLYVGVDTGPTHLAGALGVPMVALYHCRHPGRLLAPPAAPWRRIIEHPGGEAGCPAGATMAEVGVTPVLEAALALLAMGKGIPADSTPPADPSRRGALPTGEQ